MRQTRLGGLSADRLDALDAVLTTWARQQAESRAASTQTTAEPATQGSGATQPGQDFDNPLGLEQPAPRAATLAATSSA